MRSHTARGKERNKLLARSIVFDLEQEKRRQSSLLLTLSQSCHVGELKRDISTVILTNQRTNRRGGNKGESNWCNLYSNERFATLTVHHIHVGEIDNRSRVCGGDS